MPASPRKFRKSIPSYRVTANWTACTRRFPWCKTPQGIVLSDKEARYTDSESDDGQIQGLRSLPAAWPELPANAPTAAELAWVQTNRIRIVEERAGRATLVHLDQALSPAPSWAALGRLETSIPSYAKFVDVAAKATASDDGEASVMWREHIAIAEMEPLLAAMNEDDGGG